VWCGVLQCSTPVRSWEQHCIERAVGGGHVAQRISAPHCTTLRHTATHCNTLRHTATHCNTLRHTATHCDTLQHTATHCNTLYQESRLKRLRCVLQCAVCCAAACCRLHRGRGPPRCTEGAQCILVYIRESEVVQQECQKLHTRQMAHSATHCNTLW